MPSECESEDSFIVFKGESTDEDDDSDFDEETESDESEQSDCDVEFNDNVEKNCDISNNQKKVSENRLRWVTFEKIKGNLRLLNKLIL